MDMSGKEVEIMCFITGLGFLVCAFKVYHSTEGDKIYCYRKYLKLYFFAGIG